MSLTSIFWQLFQLLGLGKNKNENQKVFSTRPMYMKKSCILMIILLNKPLQGMAPPPSKESFKGAF